MAASAKAERMGCAALGRPDCSCRAAVTRAFAGMTLSGASYDCAIAVAHRVFRHHHPEIDSGFGAMIERWVSDESLH
jgi:hypothetical protein